MKLSIVDGIWQLQSIDGSVFLTVFPRRGLETAATEVTLRSEPMPALVIHPEGILEESPVQAWVWDGSTAAAHRIIPEIMSAIRARLTRSAPEAHRVRAWRERVLHSLFPDARLTAGLTRRA